jgi:CMP-N-acetylneuraminic acid synthetase
MLTVAIIPARAGSKGLPDKHLRRIGGVPMIVHTVRAALNARRIDRVLVSTNDPAVARVAAAAGAEVPFLRPADLAADDTPTLPAIRHAVEWLEHHGSSVGLIVTLQPTSPLRRAGQIDAAIALLDDPAVDSAVSVTALDLPISVVGWLERGTFRPARPPEGDLRRQASPPAVRLTGGIYVTRRALLTSGRLVGDRPAALVLDAGASIDVDTAADLAAARRAWRAAKRGRA